MFKVPSVSHSEVPDTLIIQLLQCSDLPEDNTFDDMCSPIIYQQIKQLEDDAAKTLRDTIYKLRQAKSRIAGKVLKAFNQIQTAVAEAFIKNGNQGAIFIKGKGYAQTVTGWHSGYPYKSAMVQNLVEQLSATHTITERLWLGCDDDGDDCCHGIELRYNLIEKDVNDQSTRMQ
jgi:hypothetical protein